MDETMIEKRYNRVLGLKDLIMLGLSMTLGSGIFVLTDDVSRDSKNLVWLAFVVAGIIGLLTAVSYGELSSIFNNNMGEVEYIKSVTNETTANIMGLCIIVAELFILSTVALGLGNYVSSLIGYNNQLFGIIFLFFANILNYSGIKTSTDMSKFMLCIRMCVLVLIILVAFINHKPTENLLCTKNISLSGFSTATFIALFSYLGFNNITNFAEETIDSEVNIGKAITYTVSIVIVIYTLITIASLFVLKSTDWGNTPTPLATITGKLFGSYGYTLFMILAIISLFDSILVSSLSETRFMHSIFSHIYPPFKDKDMDEIHKTPYLSILILLFFSIIIILTFNNIGTTAILGDIFILTIFIIVNIIVIILRFKRPNELRKFKIPFNIGKVPIPAVLAIFMSLYMIYGYFAG